MTWLCRRGARSRSRSGVSRTRLSRRRPLGPSSDSRSESRLALLCFGADARAVAASRLLPAAQALLDQGWSVVVPELPLGDGELRLPAAVNRIRARPLWRYLVAFDIAVASAGYSLTHELVAARLPSLLVPFSDRSGQAERSAGARGRGLALGLEQFAEAPFGAAIRELGDSGTRARLAAACQAVDLRDGTSRLTDALGLASRPCAGDSDFARGVV
jgi:UDP:flavonoid glycosyltransferase YjiC (YdhE family)